LSAVVVLTPEIKLPECEKEIVGEDIVVVLVADSI
jgi:hypothetical protein